MGNNRSKVPDLEKLVKGGRKKFVRYEEGAMLLFHGSPYISTVSKRCQISIPCQKNRVS